MDYKKALNKYNEMISKVDKEIGKKKEQIQGLKDKLNAVIEQHKETYEADLFTGTGEPKPFQNSKDVITLSTNIEIAEAELEALKSIKKGNSPKSKKLVQDLINAAYEENENILADADKTAADIEGLKKQIEALEEKETQQRAEAERVLINTTNLFMDSIRAKVNNTAFIDKMYSFRGYETLLNYLLD